LIYLRKWLSFIILENAVYAYVNDSRLTAFHVIQNFIRHRLRAGLIILCDDGFEIPKTNNPLKLLKDFFVFSVRDKHTVHRIRSYQLWFIDFSKRF